MILTGAGMVGLLSPGPVDADGHSAARSFSPATVDAGGEVVVTIEVAGLGGFGEVEETLPDGFSYVNGSASPSDEVLPAVVGQDVKFTLFPDLASFSYTVTASDVAGRHTFRGTVFDADADGRAVGGDADVTVEAGAPVVSPEPTEPEGLRGSRSLPSAPVDAGEQFDVMIEVGGLGGFGEVVETLPAGFSYVAGSASPSDEVLAAVDEVDAQKVTFSLFPDLASFTYSVTASDVDDGYTFSGVVVDSDLNEATISGDTDVTVGAGAPAHSGARSFSDSTVEPGDEVVVTITVADVGGFGQVVETLPAGFAYVDGSATPSDEVVTGIAGQAVTFTLFPELSSFTYTVTASDAEGDHVFSGMVANEDGQNLPVGGDSTVTVAVPVTPTPVTPTASPTAAPSPTTGISVTTARVRTLTAGGSSTRVNLPSIFSDMETDGLTYTAVSSRTSVVRARVSGIILRLTPGGAGTARITVTATDDDGNKERRTFTVRVRAAELPPVGDLTAPDWLLALLALAGAALLPAGVLTLRSRRRRSTA